MLMLHMQMHRSRCLGHWMASPSNACRAMGETKKRKKRREEKIKRYENRSKTERRGNKTPVVSMQKSSLPQAQKLFVSFISSAQKGRPSAPLQRLCHGLRGALQLYCETVREDPAGPCHVVLAGAPQSLLG